MNSTVVPFGEAALTVAEIEVPPATESFVETEQLDLTGVAMQVFAPRRECLTVVLGDVFAHYRVDDLGHLDLGLTAGADHLATAKDRHFVDNALNFVKAVRDIDNGGALAAHLAQQVVQSFDFVFAQCLSSNIVVSRVHWPFVSTFTSARRNMSVSG